MSLTSIKNELAIARAREANARRAVEGQKAETQKLSERSIQYSVLLREAEKNRELYENLLKRLKETSVAGELGTTNVRIVDRAEVPGSPARPKQGAKYSALRGGRSFHGLRPCFFLRVPR